jgi:hypothetical protein
VGGSAEGDRQLQSLSAADGVKPIAFAVSNLETQIINFGDRVLEIEDKILETIQLLNILDDMTNQLETGALGQGNSQVSVDSVSRQRQGKLHGKA